jgi:hypothetical protein
VSPPPLKVDVAGLLALASRLSDLGVQLSTSAAIPAAGPAWQPSAAAAGKVSSAVSHVAGECGNHLSGFGDKCSAAANAYAGGDAAGAAAVSGSMSLPR